MVRPVSVAPPAKQAVHVLSLSAGRLRSLSRMLPTFLIVGAQRCGTTSMYRTLCQHPAVVKAVLHKGVHYFDMAYDRGPGWYQAHFPLRAVARRTTRAAGAAPVTFESSPYYMFHPLAAERIPAHPPRVPVLGVGRGPAGGAP